MASSMDHVIERYKQDVDRTLLRARHQRSVEERLRDLMELQPRCASGLPAGKGPGSRTPR